MTNISNQDILELSQWMWPDREWDILKKGEYGFDVAQVRFLKSCSEHRDQRTYKFFNPLQDANDRDKLVQALEDKGWEIDLYFDQYDKIYRVEGEKYTGDTKKDWDCEGYFRGRCINSEGKTRGEAVVLGALKVKSTEKETTNFSKD